jgi:hypothetical protein
LAEHVAAILQLGKRVVADVVEIGRRLSECKRICGHGNWLPWLDREFGWTEKTAERFMSVHALAGKSDNLSNLDLPISGLYLLAAPSTPKEARDAIIERAQGGEPVSVAEVKQTIDAAKGRKQPAKKAKQTKIADGEPVYQVLDDGTRKKITWQQLIALPPEPSPAGPSWRVEVTDASGKVWSSGVRVRTKEEASRYMLDALDAFTSADWPIVEMRTLESSDTPNVSYERYVSGRHKGRYSYRAIFAHGTCGNFGWQEGNDAPAVYADTCAVQP